MKKNALCFFFPVMMLFFLVSGCTRPAQEPDPKAALAGYLDALVSGNSEEAAKYLTMRTNRQSESKPKEPDSFEAKMVRRALASHISYEITIVERTDAKARAKATIKSPDFQMIARDIAARLAAAKFPAGPVESLDYATEIVNGQILVYKDQGLPMTSNSRNYELVKEGGAWKISGWD